MVPSLHETAGMETQARQIYVMGTGVMTREFNCKKFLFFFFLSICRNIEKPDGLALAHDRDLAALSLVKPLFFSPLGRLYLL